MSRGVYTDHIIWHMSVLSSEVISNSKIGRVNIDVDTEMTMCNVVNLLEGWNLSSLNEGKANYPGIDLADWNRRIAIQITATADGHKVNHTLEQFFKNKLNEAFDRLIVLIINDKNCPVATPRESGSFYFDPKKDIWNLNTIAEKVKLLSDPSLLKTLSETLNTERRFLPLGPQHPLPGVPLPARHFLKDSRNTELTQLEAMLSSKQPVFICGVGGIGKTEIAIQLAERVSSNRKTYFLSYCSLPEDSEKEAMRETILQANFAGYSFRREDNDARDLEYRARMDMLAKDYPGSLIIIDNFDRDGKTLANLQNEACYRELISMGILLVFTTRSQTDDGIEIKPLTEDQLLELMIRELKDDTVQEAQLRELIRAVEGHTLMVILMAKTLKESWGDVSPEQMLLALKKSKLNQQEYPEVVMDKNHSKEQKQIYAHIKALFDLSGLNQDDKAILRYATLLPETGLGDKLFKASIPKNDQQRMRNLVARGWIRRDQNVITIHPVIQDVCREELQPKDQDCNNFLWTLYDQYNPKNYNVTQIWQLAECMSQAADILDDGWGDWSYYAALLWDEIGQIRAALHYSEQAIDRRLVHANRRANPEFRKKRYLKLASAYNIASHAYGHGGNHEKAKLYGEEALKLRKKYLPTNHRQIAASYNNLGMIYSHLGFYQKALNYLWIAVRMRAAQKDPRQDELANSYNNIGTVYHSMGKHDKALIFREKALNIRRELFKDDPRNPDLVSSINNVGRALHELGRYEEALELELEALRSREAILHETDWELANSYYNVGHTFGAMEKYPEAVQYLEKALHTWRIGQAEDNIYYASTKDELAQYLEHLSLQKI